jgi:hypothetical protein
MNEPAAQPKMVFRDNPGVDDFIKKRINGYKMLSNPNLSGGLDVFDICNRQV